MKIYVVIRDTREYSDGSEVNVMAFTSEALADEFVAGCNAWVAASREAARTNDDYEAVYTNSIDGYAMSKLWIMGQLEYRKEELELDERE